MTAWVDALKESSIPDYAKDTKLNLDAVIKRSTLPVEEAEAVALAAAFATGNSKLWTWIDSQITNRTEAIAALTAGALMAQNNVWYPFVEMADDENLKGLPAGLRMTAYANHAGVSKKKFEMYALCASIVGKCNFCVKSHYDLLKKEGMTVAELQHVGKIAAVINAVGKIASVY